MLKWLKRMKGRLANSELGYHFDELKRFFRRTAPIYGSKVNHEDEHGKVSLKVRLMQLMWLIPLITCLFFILTALCDISGWINPILGLIIGVAVFCLLLIELLLFRPRIFVILDLQIDDVHSELYRDFPASRTAFTISEKIENWKTFFREKDIATRTLKDTLISTENLRLRCIVQVFCRVIVLMAWYSVIIMYADISLCRTILDIQNPQQMEYLYQSIGLFLSVSTKSVLTASVGGICLLFGQVLIYFSVLIVTIGRFVDYMSMYTHQIENIAHLTMVNKLNIKEADESIEKLMNALPRTIFPRRSP